MGVETEKLISLVTAAQKGDNNAMNELFNAYYNDLYYFALKSVKDEELALDITQEAFVEIINTINTLKVPEAFVTWAKQITYHQCTRYFKKKKDVLVDEDEEGNTVFDTLKEENAEFIPDEALDINDFKKTILSILDELSEEQRSATMMYYFDEMSVKQIAEIQGVTEGTVKSRLNYARKTIKNSVEEYEKKNGVKLHAIGCLPLFKWLFKGAFEGGISTASAETVASGVSAATGTTVSVASTSTVVVTSAAITTTASAVGIGAKNTILPIVIKVLAVVAAVTVAVGGGTVAVVKVIENFTKPAIESNATPENIETIAEWDESNALLIYSNFIAETDLSNFYSVDDISPNNAIRFGYSYWKSKNEGNIYKVEDLDKLCNTMFGRTFDWSKLSKEYGIYDKKSQTVEIIPPDVEYKNVTYANWLNPPELIDGTYTKEFTIYKFSEVSTEPYELNDFDEYYTTKHGENEYVLYEKVKTGYVTIEEKEGRWVIKSFVGYESYFDMLMNEVMHSDDFESGIKGIFERILAFIIACIIGFFEFLGNALNDFFN